MYKNNKGVEEFFDDSWAHMHGLLDEHFPEKEKKKRRIAFWFWTGMTVFFFVGAAMYWLPKSEKGQVNSLKTKSAHSIQQEQKIAPIKPSKGNVHESTPEVLPAPINNIIEEQKPIANKKIKNDFIPTKRDPILVANNKDILELKPLANKPKSSIDPVNTHLTLIKKTDINKVSRDVKLVQPLPTLKLVKPLPILANKLLFAKAGEMKFLKHKPKKKMYYELYTGGAWSNLGYYSGFFGADIGRQIVGRWYAELGLGYRTVYAKGVFIDSLTNTVVFSQYENDYYSSGFGTTISLDMTATKNSMQLHLVEMPLKLRYRFSPNWSIYGDIIGVYQFSKQMAIADVSNAQTWLKSSKYIPVKDLTAHLYMGVGGGIAYERKHWQLSVGYNNWALFGQDNQLYIGTKYRF